MMGKHCQLILDRIPFETKVNNMSRRLYKQMEETEKLDEVIQKNSEEWAYGN